jgi:hypothetical protein
MRDSQWTLSKLEAPRPARLFGLDLDSLLESLSLENILASLEGQFDPEVVELAKEYLAKAEAQLAAERTARRRRSRRSAQRARGASQDQYC